MNLNENELYDAERITKQVINYFKSFFPDTRSGRVRYMRAISYRKCSPLDANTAKEISEQGMKMPRINKRVLNMINKFLGIKRKCTECPALFIPYKDETMCQDCISYMRPTFVDEFDIWSRDRDW